MVSTSFQCLQEINQQMKWVLMRIVPNAASAGLMTLLLLAAAPGITQDSMADLLAPIGTGSDVVTVDILDEKIVHDGRYIVGVRMHLEDGWRSYWRLPDASGLPTQFHVLSTRNVESIRIHWPAPSLVEQFGSLSIGYVGEIVFPMEIIPQDVTNDQVHLQSIVQFGICKDVCIPMSREIVVDVPTLDTTDTFGPIAHALENLPLDHIPTAPGDTITCLPIEIAGSRLQAVVPLPAWQQVDRVAVIFEDVRGRAYFAPPVITRVAPDRLHLATKLQFLTDERAPLRSGELQVLMLFDTRAYEIPGCPG